MASASVFAVGGLDPREIVRLYKKETSRDIQRDMNMGRYPNSVSATACFSESNPIDLSTTNSSKPVNNKTDFTNKKRYMCPVCSKRLSHRYTLDRHLKTVCGKIRNTTGKWQCVCERRYESQGSLSRHLKYECDQPPQFNCIFCNKFFSQKCSLTRHLKKKHRIPKTS